MFDGKMKAITFSYDDAVIEDRRFIGILDKYGLKGTFNLNSGWLGKETTVGSGDRCVPHIKWKPDEIEKIYRGHEIAAHTLSHPSLPTLSDEEVIREVEEDRKELSRLAGYEVVGMAYPGGGINNDDRVATLIKNYTGIRYARTITTTGSFELQENLYRFNPTLYHIREGERHIQLAEKFLDAKPEKPQIFYIWGHTYEFEMYNDWNKIDEFCRMISGRRDIFYGTNKQVLLGMK